MNTMFTKILLWFGIMLALMFAGVVAITAIQFQNSPPRGPWQPFYAELAVNAFERDGPEGLRQFLNRYGASTNANVFLLDPEGRDVLTGKTHELPRDDAGIHIPFISKPSGGPRVAEWEGYKVVAYPRREESFAWWVIPQNLWILGVGIVLCFLLAAYLSSPLRKIQRVVEQYGEGNLDLRMSSKRRDEFGKLARAFDRMADRIQTLLAAEKRLLLDISHELRSPLARMSVAIELLDDAGERDAAKSQIRRETERLNELIGGLIEVTRAEGEPAALQTQTVSMDDLLGEILRDCGYEARERSVEIVLDSTPGLEVKGDAELLRRAVENVLRNALRYAPAHSNVTLTCAVEQMEVSLRIRDFGPGAPEDLLERLFDPFFRVENDRNRRQGGTGLGLSIARRAVAVHGGSIEARNANPGLCVEIRLAPAGTGQEA
ncbi:MAG: HAMP domain-containing histidine kinase [Bryobacterales bacterium]|nr:HAMP domain-containing histidine kinase [Bryobacterales bacterium]